MKKDIIIQDYFGALTLIRSKKDDELTIFLVDDDEFYLKLVKTQLQVNPKFSIYTFTSGEECLDFVEAEPDLIILDYHLDGKMPFAQKGDVIYLKLKDKLPKVEIFLVSTDKKVEFIDGIKKLNLQNGVLFKDEQALNKIKSKSGQLLERKTTLFHKIITKLFGSDNRV